MKNTLRFAIVAALASSIFAGCSKETNQEVGIEGTWQRIGYFYEDGTVKIRMREALRSAEESDLSEMGAAVLRAVAKSQNSSYFVLDDGMICSIIDGDLDEVAHYTESGEAFELDLAAFDAAVVVNEHLYLSFRGEDSGVICQRDDPLKSETSEEFNEFDVPRNTNATNV